MNETMLGNAHVLDQIREYLTRYVVYPTSQAAVAHTLWIAHAWLMDRWDSTPRIAFISKEPGSGKSRALEVTAPLVPRPVHAVNATPAYLFRKVSDPAGAPTILFDEIDTLFGPRAKDNEEVRGMLNAGHRRGATAGRAVVKGKEVVTEELPSYAAVALAGLNDLPDTLRARSVVIQMRRRAPNEQVKPWRMRTGEGEASPLKEALQTWVGSFPPNVVWPDMPTGVEDRDADVWEALLAVADHAGGQWPHLARDAATTLVAESKERPQTMGTMLLADIRSFFNQEGSHGRTHFPTEDILTYLHGLEESPWGNIRGNPLDAQGLARRLRGYGIRPNQRREGTERYRGYDVSVFQDSFSRYLPQDNPVTGEPAVTGQQSRQNYSSQAEPVSVTGEPVPVTNTQPRDKGEPVEARNHAEVTGVTGVTGLWGGTHVGGHLRTPSDRVVVGTSCSQHGEFAPDKKACPMCGGPVATVWGTK